MPGLTPEALTTYGGTSYKAVAASTATDTVVKAAPGRLCRVVVIATAANPMAIYDNASAGSGTQIGALPANPAVGSSYDFHVPVSNGITIKGSATNPGVVVTFY